MVTRKHLGGTTASALLGLLTLRPMSGYDMRALIDRSIGHFWSESYGQIYPTLKRLAAAGLVEKKTERQKGKPDRNVFSITEAGREQLAEWLKTPPTPEVPRSELLLKLFFGHHVSTQVSREYIEALLVAHTAALQQYAALEKQIKRDGGSDPQLPYWLMTVSFGKQRSSALIRWARESLQTLDQLEGRRKKKPARTR